MNVCRKNSKQASMLQHSKMQMQQVFKREERRTVDSGQRTVLSKVNVHHKREKYSVEREK